MEFADSWLPAVNPVPVRFSQPPGLQTPAALVAGSTTDVTLSGPVLSAVVRVREPVAVKLLNVAVRVAVAALFMVLAVAVNVPLLALPAIVILGGTVTNSVSLAKLTVTAFGVTAVSVTVHVVLLPLASVVDKHVSVEIAGVAVVAEIVSEKVFVTAPALAVSTAV